MSDEGTAEPLGDLRERRGLITVTLVLTAAALAVAAAAPGIAVFGAALAVVGVTSVVAQVIVPMSSSLAAERERGQVVGMVMSGLLIGILLARTASGLISAALGWRTVFVFAAVAMLTLAATVRRALPAVPPTEELSYGALDLAGVPALGRAVSLRQRGHRAIRSRRRGGRAGRIRGGTSGEPGPRPGHHHGIDPGAAGELGRARVGPRFGDRADRGHRSARPWCPGLAHLKPKRDLCAAPRCPQPAHHGLHVSYFVGGAILSAAASTMYASSGCSGVCILGAATSAFTLLVRLLPALGSRADQRSALEHEAA